MSDQKPVRTPEHTEHVGSTFEVVSWEQAPADDLVALFSSNKTADEEELLAVFKAYKHAKEKAIDVGAVDSDTCQSGLDFLDEFIHDGEALNWREKLFVAEFLVDLHPARAAGAAGYERGSASGLMRRPKIIAAVKTAMERRMLRLRITQDRVLTELSKLAFSSLTDVVDVQGNVVTVKDLDSIPAEKRAAIKEVTETRGPNGTTIKVVMHDKNAPLTQLGRHLGLFSDKLKIEDTTSAAETMKRARERVINAKRVDRTTDEGTSDA